MSEIMKLAVCGPHSSGKTTLLAALKETSEFSNISFLPEVTRVIKAQGYNINEAGTQDTQILIMATHMQNLLTKNRFIVDRCLIDGLCYSRFLYENPSGDLRDNVQEWFIDYCEDLVERYLSMYTKIFYIPAEIAVVHDGVRSTDTFFHEEIVKIFERNIRYFNNMYPGLITVVRGSVEQRVQIVLEALRKLGE